MTWYLVKPNSSAAPEQTAPAWNLHCRFRGSTRKLQRDQAQIGKRLEAGGQGSQWLREDRTDPTVPHVQCALHRGEIPSIMDKMSIRPSKRGHQVGLEFHDHATSFSRVFWGAFSEEERRGNAGGVQGLQQAQAEDWCVAFLVWTLIIT